MDEIEITKELAAHEARNTSLRRVLVDKHVDLKQSRKVECHFWLPSEQDASALIADLRARGFDILVQRAAATPDPVFRWNVEAAVIQSVDLTTRREFTDELVRLAALHRGRYDGWGTLI